MVSKRLNEMNGITCSKPEGAFYVWADISELSNSSTSFCNDLLEKQKVVAVAGSPFGTAREGYICLALVQSTNILIKAMNRIENYTNKV